MANLRNTNIDENLELAAGTTSQRPASAQPGQVRYNTDLEVAEFYNGTNWQPLSDTQAEAAGGTVIDTDIGGVPHRIHYFTETGTDTLTVTNPGEVEYLIVAGGGGGGGSAHGAGGGAGGVVTGKTFLTVDNYPVEVGTGGAGKVGRFSSAWLSAGTNFGENGGNSSAFGITAEGGGGGGGYSGGGGGDTVGRNGGSGGGTGRDPSTAGQALQPASSSGGFGNNGGVGGYAYTSSLNISGGGGGAGESGWLRDELEINRLGHGGNGITSAITGKTRFYAGGGGGSSYGVSLDYLKNPPGGFGGGGIGDDTAQPLFKEARAGMPNTGGGGGGAERNSSGDATGGDGGSGIVIVRYSKNTTVVSEPDAVDTATQTLNELPNNTGLGLLVDANNQFSYPGTGSTWFNLANGNDITLNNGASFQTYNIASVEFDGSNDYAFTTLNNIDGDWIHSICFWMYLNRDQSQISSRVDPFQIGNNSSTSQYSAMDIADNNINWYFYSNDVRITQNLFEARKWYHIGLTYTGGGANTTNKRFYLNGDYIPWDTGNGGADLNIAANANCNIGRDGERNSAYFDGRINDFTVFHRALEEREVVKLFNATRFKYGV